MLDPLQLVALIALAIGAATYVWRGFKRGMAADAAFFASLVERLSQMLEPKGFHLTRNTGRSATFEGRTLNIEAFWDYSDRFILLLRRDVQPSHGSAGQTLAHAHIPPWSSPANYAQAMDAILAAASSIEAAV